MASIDYSTSPYTINIPQSDLTLISGTLYELDTDAFRLNLKSLEAAAQGIVFQDTHRHNTEVTVAGTTFARTFEILNSTNSSNLDEYQIQFTPDSQYTVRLAGSNNNIFDVENAILAQNQVQVIAQNSGGLISPAADQVLAATLTSGETVDVALSRLIVMAKILRNRTETDPVSGVMTVYDDDNVTPLFTANIYEGTDVGQPYRGQGAERRNRLE